MKKQKQKQIQKYILCFLALVLLLAGMPGTGAAVRAAGARYSADMEAEAALLIDEAGAALEEIAAEREIMALVYLADEYPVRTTPSYEGEIAVTVLSGQQVNILDVYLDDNYEVWEYVWLEYEGNEYYGYIPRTCLAVSDARFLSWEETYGMNPKTYVYGIDAGGQTVYADIEQFPASYRAALTELKQQHPNWTFVKMNTTLDWNDVIYNELQGGKSLAHKSLPDWAKNGLYDTGNWYYATEAAVKVYMDPRNNLSESAIFQFEQLTYNEEYHTLEAMQSFLNNTFMNDSKPAPGMSALTFAELFWLFGKEECRKVSPFHLAARVLQEQGQGTSPLISGTYPGYEGYYNYFNIGASGKTNQEVYENGLKYAKDHGWINAYFAIRDGADFISANYIRKGQDTLYLQKFNVNPKGSHAVYTHQYMQNISAPKSEAQSIRKLYADANALDSPFVFKIPVYLNMPGAPCAAPGTEPEDPVVETLDISLKLPEGYNDSTVWLDGVAYQGTAEEGTVTVTASDKSAAAAVVYRYNESGVPVGMYVWSLSYGSGAYIATPEPELADLLTYHGFSIRITGKPGIRFKTGISAELRNKLAGGGVNRYRLREYGTLVMNNANRDRYPMVKGGEKVQSGMAYGADGNGGFTDVVYETVDGRYRYTSVLVGMPAAQYKTEYAFRGYIILEKDGKSITLYGPPVAKSIYSLAEQLLERGSYDPGSATYEFLTGLINEAEGN
ncbi:MAG: hypothetical protein NC123_06530 [Butyrivibrio sp.]|nr:hypothetical protein [Acetatifactor muris]MCM1559183.1 hypothetical protein [Butyrivibrio sp.]